MRAVLQIVFCLLWIANLTAADFTFHHLSLNEGLSHNTVEGIVQDDDGFLWFGTQDGLNRFDGYEFKVFRREQENANSLSDNFVTCLYKDDRGNLWIGTNNGGLNLLQIREMSFSRFTHNPADENSIAGNNIRVITADSSGRTFIGTLGNGLSVYSPQSQQFENYKNQAGEASSIPNNFVWTIHIDRKQRIWLGTQGGGLARMMFQPDGKVLFHTYKSDIANPNSLSDNYISSIIDLSDDILLVGTMNGGLNRIDLSSGKISRLRNDPQNPNSLSSDIVNILFKDRNGHIWVGTDNKGLNLYDDGSRSFTRFKTKPASPFSISSNRIASIYQDEAGLLWIGTRDKGVNFLNPNGTKFSVWKNLPGDINSLGYNTIRAIYSKDPDILWLGTLGGGLDRFDRVNNKFSHFHNNPADIHSLSNDRVSAILMDSQSNLWVGTWGGGLNKQIGKGKFKRFLNNPDNPNSISDNRIQVIYENDPTGLWIGTENGLNYFDPRTEKFTRFLNDPENVNSLTDNRIESNCIQSDRFGNLWVGTWNGLNKIILTEDRRGIKKVIRYMHQSGNPLSLGDNRIISLLADESAQGDTITLWGGTYDEGLNKLTFLHLGAEKDSLIGVVIYGAAEGMPNEMVFGLLKDNLNNIWMSTNNGLCRMNRSGKPRRLFDVFTVSDGLQSNQFYWGAAHKLSTGEMVFGGIEGFNIFHPDSIRLNEKIPPVFITDFFVNNRSISDNNILHRKQFELSHGMSIFSLRFAALDLISPSENRFVYKLEGFDDEWIPSQSHREATYTNLDPGTYIFRVKGSNSDGIWNEEGASLTIKVLPVWWQTLWFRLAMIAFLILTIIAIYKIRMAGIKNHNLQLEEHNRLLNEQIAEREKLQVQLTQAQKMESIGILAGGVAHDFNNLLTVINGRAELGMIRKDIETVKKDLKAILTSGKRAIALTGQLLAFSRKQVIQPVQVNINNILENIESMLHSLAGDAIELIMELDPQLPGTVADVSQIEQIILNLVINARDAINDPRNKKMNRLISIRTSSIEITDDATRAHLACDPGSYIKIAVSDTGIGMDDNLQQRVFDPFFTTKEQGKGTGLGLSTVYGIIKQNKAGISLYSDPGHGSTFNIYWPVIVTDEDKLSSGEHHTSIPQSGSETIIVVEDDDQVRDFTRETLEDLGYTVHIFSDGQEAIKFIRKNDEVVHLLISDMIMPGMNGQELAEKIQSLRPGIKVLYSSGYTDNHIVKKGVLEAGVNFIQKPFTIAALSQKVRQIFEEN